MTTDELIREAEARLSEWRRAPLQRPGEDAETMIPALVAALKAEQAKVKTSVEALRRIADGNHMGCAGDTALSIARDALAEIEEMP